MKNDLAIMDKRLKTGETHVSVHSSCSSSCSLDHDVIDKIEGCLDENCMKPHDRKRKIDTRLEQMHY